MGDESENKESTGESKDGGKKKGGSADRSASAKAFYRAMYAGAEPDPEEYGLSSQEAEQKERSGPCSNCARLQSEMEQLEKRTLEAENHWKRMAADFENYRKRVAREKEEFSANGIQRAIEAILPALDDMDLAKSKLTTDMDSANMMESLNMVYNRFNRCLEQIGIKQMEVIGEMFDPLYHEPVQQIPSNAVADGAVVHQLRPGYMFNDKVLRPSLVNVATAVGADQLESFADSDVAAAESSEQDSSGKASVGEASEEETATDEQASDWDNEESPGSLTQDLPIVDLDANLQPSLFEEKKEAESSSEE